MEVEGERSTKNLSLTWARFLLFHFVLVCILNVLFSLPTFSLKTGTHVAGDGQFTRVVKIPPLAAVC